MAIKISGTTVIDNSRNGTNLGIVTATSFDGDGSGLTNLPPSGGTMTATASGSISNGAPVIIQNDGKVKSVAGCALTTGQSDIGTFESGAIAGNGFASVYDSGNKKVVTFYIDDDDSDKLKAVVATVSGGSISFGTPVEVSSSGTLNDEFYQAAYDAASGKIVIAYRDRPSDQNRCVARVGTVSGTSISFGSVTVIESQDPAYVNVGNAGDNKVVVCWSRGGDGHGVIGTISGTSISFGSQVTFESGNAHEKWIIYDEDLGMPVVYYRDGDNYTVGKVIFVDGTTISYGDIFYVEGNSVQSFNVSGLYHPPSKKHIVFISYNSRLQCKAIHITGNTNHVALGDIVQISANNYSRVRPVYNPDTENVIVPYYDTTDNMLTIQEISIDGTTVTVLSGETDILRPNSDIGAAYDTSGSRAVISFADYNDSSKGKSSVYSSTSTPNLANFIGFSDAAYTDGNTATIQIVSSTDDAQSSLTVGSKHYLQGDGTLSTTPDSPSVLAGTAISGTEIIIKR
tara:strand:+ start:3501 stop:5039 length:1539 start_codon:yes stop_codon:yes gene_type:complete